MTSIQSAIFDHKENEPDSYFASLLWPATGEHLTRDLFLRYRKQGGMIILPSNTQENIDAAIESPLTMIASDGHLLNGKGHPRTAGTYARVLGHYVREERVLDLMTALKKNDVDAGAAAGKTCARIPGQRENSRGGRRGHHGL